MLEIVIPGEEFWDQSKSEFVYTESVTLQLEHSLISISKWEMKYKKPFLTTTNKTDEESLYYIKCMTLNKVNDNVYNRLNHKNMSEINSYIDGQFTATFVRTEDDNKVSKEPITSELIYYWMVSLNIPYVYEKWHLSRLLTLIRVCNHKNSPPKKRSKKEMWRSNNELNKKRRKMMNTTG